MVRRGLKSVDNEEERRKVSVPHTCLVFVAATSKINHFYIAILGEYDVLLRETPIDSTFRE